MKIFRILMLFLFSFGVFADEMHQNTDVNAGSLSQAVSKNNFNFGDGSKTAPLPQFGINTGITGPALFQEATRNAGLLYEAYLNALKSCGKDDDFTTLDLAKKKLEGIQEKYENAEARFSPTNHYMWQTNGKERELSDNAVIKAPSFGTSLELKQGRYLGLIYVSSLQDEIATQADLMAAVELLVLKKIQPYFMEKRLHLVFVPGGSGINIGVSTQGTSKGFFATIGSLLGGASSGIGGSYSSNNGTTHFAATLGNQVLVFVDGEGIPISINVPPKEEPVAKIEPVIQENESSNIIVNVTVGDRTTKTTETHKKSVKKHVPKPKCENPTVKVSPSFIIGR